MDETASTAVQEFAETGGTTALEKLHKDIKNHNITNITSSTAGEDLVLDWFTAPPLDKGADISETKLFLDGNHTMVRIMY